MKKKTTELTTKEQLKLIKKLNQATKTLDAELRRRFASRVGSLQTTTDQIRAYLVNPAEYNPSKSLLGVNVLLNDLRDLVNFLHEEAKKE